VKNRRTSYLIALCMLFCAGICGCATYSTFTNYGEPHYKEAREYYDAKEYAKAMEASFKGQQAIRQYIRDCQTIYAGRRDCWDTSAESFTVERLQTLDAWIYYFYGNKDTAFNMAIKLNNPESELLLGRIHAERGNYSDAAKSYFAMVGKPVWPNPPARSGNIDMARPLFSLIAPDDATLTERIKKDPSSPELYRLRGLLRESMGQQALALKDYTAYLQKDECRGRGERGMALMRQGKYTEAFDDFDALIKKCEPRHSSHYYRGLAAQYLGNLDAAMADYTYVPKDRKPGFYDLGTEFTDLQKGIINVKKGKKDQATGSMLRWAITRMPLNIEARTTYILYLVQGGFLEGARGQLEELKKIDPKAAEKLSDMLKLTGLMEN